MKRYKKKGTLLTLSFIPLIKIKWVMKQRHLNIAIHCVTTSSSLFEESLCVLLMEWCHRELCCGTYPYSAVLLASDATVFCLQCQRHSMWPESYGFSDQSVCQSVYLEPIEPHTHTTHARTHTHTHTHWQALRNAKFLEAFPGFTDLTHSMECDWELWQEYFQVECFQVVDGNFLSVAWFTDWVS